MLKQESGIETNLKVIKLDGHDMAALDTMAEGGKQQRVNTPPWNTDFVGCANRNRKLLTNQYTGLPGLVWAWK